MIKTKVAFLEGRLFPVNQSFLKTLQISLIGWIKASPLNKPLLFLSCKQAVNFISLSLGPPVVVAQPSVRYANRTVFVLE